MTSLKCTEVMRMNRLRFSIYLGANEGNNQSLKKAITDLGIWIGQSSNTLVYTRDCRENIYALEYFGKV